MDFDTLSSFFKDWSGRVDLDDEAVTHYLNAGQRFLDDFTDFQQNPSRYIYNSTIGDFYLSLVAQAKIIERVQLSFEGNVYKVSEISLAELQTISTNLPSFVTLNLPEFFSLATQRNVGATLGVSDRAKLAVIETGTVSDRLGLLFNCPVDKAYTVDIYGKFYSPTIIEGVDPDTFWAMQYPFTLLHAALFKLEIGYRNTEGANDWLAAIKLDTQGIDRNVAEQSSTNSSEMRG